MREEWWATWLTVRHLGSWNGYLVDGRLEPFGRLRVLGVFRVHRDRQIVFVSATAARRVLAYLAVNGATGRDRIAADLWPDSDRCGAELRTGLWRLRQVCPGFLEDCDQVLALAEGVSVDLDEVNAWADEAIAPSVFTSANQSVSPPAGAGDELLPGWTDPWLDASRTRLRIWQIQAFEAVAGRLLAAGRTAEAVKYALHASQSEPLRESAQCLMLEIHLRQGNVNEAVLHYDAYCARLRDALGIAPGMRVTSLIAPYIPHQTSRRRTS